jgi:hypothetical protein
LAVTKQLLVETLPVGTSQLAVRANGLVSDQQRPRR